MKLLSSKTWILLAALSAGSVQAQQFFGSGYEDYGTFATDPVELDNEVSDLFGRFFQNSFHIGTNILTGGLGKAYGAGILLDFKFVFYFDKIWAGEIGGGWAQHSGSYTATNTGVANISVRQSMSLVPIQLGIRYGFDQEILPRGFSVMNPYLSANAELIFRSEGVVGSGNDVRGITSTNGSELASKFSDGSINTSRGVGVNFGGGMEFDIYRRKLYLGLDLRYHLLFWSDADVLVGKLERRGNAVSIQGGLTYNY